MIPPENLLAFVALAAAIIAVPGPSVLFVVSRAVAHGRRAALTTVVGNTGGLIVQVTAVALGIGGIITQSVALFTALKLIGAAYLVFLGVRAIRRRRAGAATATPVVAPAKPMGRVLREGFVVGVTNPKMIVFVTAALPQFMDRSAGDVAGQLLLLGLVLGVLALMMDSVWALGAGSARDWFVRSPKRLAQLSAGGGVVMIGLGVGLLATGRPEPVTR
jgi:threonine/homoserine/homoserine lactone efflux protein